MSRVRTAGHVIAPVTELPDGLTALCADAEAEGFDFVTRFQAAWLAGENRFDLPGEIMLAAWDGADLAGLCGLNRDPYGAGPGVGRLRHLYVRPALRRQGIAAALVDRVLAVAQDRFHRVRLRVPGPEAARFYERIGFQRVEEPQASHAVTLPARGGPG